MAVGKEARGTLWVEGQVTARVRGPAPSPARIARIRRPFALIGSLPGADIRIDDPAAAPRHVLLLLDRRGVFGVDLLTGSGTRFAGAAAGSAWLGAGDVLEVAGHRVEILRLLVDGRAIDPPLCPDDPFSPDPAAPLASVALEPLDAPGAPWMLGSALAFLGRGDGCAIRVEDASETHCALLRGPGGAYLIDLHGRRTLLGGRPVEGASALLDGDVLTVGEARFGLRIGPADPHRSAGAAIVPVGHAPPHAPEALMARLVGALLQGGESSRGEILDAVRRLQSETHSLLDIQLDRVESLAREVAALRDEVRGHRGPPRPPAAPFRLDLRATQGHPASTDSAAWLLDRLERLEVEARPAWRDLLGRIGSAIHPRAAGETSPDSLPARIEPPNDAPR